MGYQLKWLLSLFDKLDALGLVKGDMAQLGSQQIYDLPNKPSAKQTFIERYKIDSYTDFDINDKAQIILDLTKEIPTDYIEKYDMVVDSGTLEHIFDQKSAFENAYKMCKIGGTIVHIQGIKNLWNHSLFSYQPKIFILLSQINDYKIKYIDYLIEDVNTNQRLSNTSKIKAYPFDFDKYETVSFVIAMIKTNSDFKTPMDVS